MKRLGRYRGVVSLAALFLLTPLLVCLLALRQTATGWIACSRLENEMARWQTDAHQAQNAAEPKELPGQEKTLFHRLLPLCERYGGTLEQYTPYITRQQGGATLHTDEVTLQGEYIPLLRITQALEAQMTDCKTASLSYRLITPRNRQQTPKLKLTLIIQYITTP